MFSAGAGIARQYREGPGKGPHPPSTGFLFLSAAKARLGKGNKSLSGSAKIPHPSGPNKRSGTNSVSTGLLFTSSAKAESM